MPEYLEDEIVVTGRRLQPVLAPHISMPILDLLIGGLNFGVMESKSVPGLTVDAAITITGRRDFRVDQTIDTPEIVITGASRSQLASIVHSVTNAERFEGLSRTINEMVEKGVKLTVNVVDSAPPGYEPDQKGGITFRITAESADTPTSVNPDSLVPGSEVIITIVGSRITRDDSFNETLAHELGHLVLGPDGNFRNDYTRYNVDEIDGQLYRDLFRGFRARDFLESQDIAMVDGTYDMYGFNAKAFGTDGNNFIDSFAVSNDEIYAGAGNDVILSRAGSDSIYVSRSGAKIIVDYGTGYADGGLANGIDGITIQGVGIRALIGTRVGTDAYVTYAGSQYHPLEDPDVVIIANYYNNPGESTIEFLFADDGYIYSWELLGYPDGVAPYWTWGTMAGLPNMTNLMQPAYDSEAISFVQAYTYEGVVDPITGAQLVSYSVLQTGQSLKMGLAVDVLRETRLSTFSADLEPSVFDISNEGTHHLVDLYQSVGVLAPSELVV